MANETAKKRPTKTNTPPVKKTSTPTPSKVTVKESAEIVTDPVINSEHTMPEVVETLLKQCTSVLAEPVRIQVDGIAPAHVNISAALPDNLVNSAISAFDAFRAKCEEETRILKIKADFLTRNAKNKKARIFQEGAVLGL